MPELIAIKMARMAVSPFGFFRGSAPPIAADLAIYPNTTILVQICGDAHVRIVPGSTTRFGGAASKRISWS